VRARIALPSALCFALAGCTSTPDFDKLQWGEPVKGDYGEAVERAKRSLQRNFRHLDPDRTQEAQGDLWSLWHADRGEFNRSTFRRRGRVRVERIGDDRFRVGVSVFQQLSDNIENPSSVQEARWVKTTRLFDREDLMRREIEARYREFRPSERYLNRKDAETDTTPRPDLIDRYKDVELEGAGTIDPERAPPKVTGPEKDEPK